MARGSHPDPRWTAPGGSLPVREASFRSPRLGARSKQDPSRVPGVAVHALVDPAGKCRRWSLGTGERVGSACPRDFRGCIREGRIPSTHVPAARCPLRPDGPPKSANNPPQPAVPRRVFLPEDAARRRRARGRKMSNQRGESATTIDPGSRRRRRVQGTRATPRHRGTRRPRRNQASRVRAQDDARWIEDEAILARPTSGVVRTRSSSRGSRDRAGRGPKASIQRRSAACRIGSR